MHYGIMPSWSWSVMHDFSLVLPLSNPSVLPMHCRRKEGWYFVCEIAILHPRNIDVAMADEVPVHVNIVNFFSAPPNIATLPNPRPKPKYLQCHTLPCVRISIHTYLHISSWYCLVVRYYIMWLEWISHWNFIYLPYASRHCQGTNASLCKVYSECIYCHLNLSSLCVYLNFIDDEDYMVVCHNGKNARK